MTEDLSLKQTQQGSSLPFLTGAAIGGASGYYVTNKYAKPKYGSYEELINEKQDTFDTKLKAAAEGSEDKKFLDAVKDIRDSYNTEFEAYKKAQIGEKAAAEVTPEEIEKLEKKFIESKGFSSKSEFIKNNAKDKVEALEQQYKKFLEGKLGAKAGLKVASIAAASALVLGLLSNAVFNKKNA